MTEAAAASQLSTQHRALPPKLSADQFKSAQNTPHSLLESASSGLLSPVTLNPWNRSPPPRLHTNDYIGSKARWDHKKRHQARHAREYHDSLKNNRVPIPSLDLIAQISRSECNMCETGSRREHSASISGRSSGKTPSRATSNDRPFNIRSWKSTPGDEAFLKKATFSEPVAPPESPAIIALRRLSQPSLASSILLPGVVRRLSNAVSATFNIGTTPSTPKSGAQSPQDRCTKSLLERSNESPNLRPAYRNGSAQRPMFTDHLDTPASITVRKASNPYLFPARPYENKLVVSPSDLETQAGATQINPPSVELVAFYSEHRQGVSPQSGLAGCGLGVATSVIHENCRISMQRSPAFGHSRRQSGVADPAITLADVHIAPGTFLTNNTSSKASLAPPDIPQRVSAIQFRSRNSVHEVIWREDETTSISSHSCSSHGSSSPDRSAQFQTISPLSPDLDASASDPSRNPTGQGLHIPFLDPEQDLGSTQSQAKFFQFSWNRFKVFSPDTKTEHTIIPTESDSDVPYQSHDATISTTPEDSGSQGRELGSVSIDPPHVASFPTLLDRQPIFECCRTPLTALEDPRAGRVEVRSLHKDRSKSLLLSRKNPSDAGRAKLSIRRASDFVHPSPRLWEAGKSGSSIGISSHKCKPLPRAY